MTIIFLFLHRFRFLFAAVILVIAWAFFLPYQFGGQAGYMVVDGTSMLPGMRQGDFILLRRSPGYEIGQVVAYQNPDVGTVIHRIIGLDGNRFILKGDNNPWEDAYHPLQSDIIGKAVLKIPSAGIFIDLIKTPAVFAAFAVILFFVVVFAPLNEKKIKKKRTLNKAPNLPTFGNFKHLLHLSPLEQVVLLASTALIFILLLVLSFFIPTHRTILQDVSYQQSGNFYYAAPVPPDLYDHDYLQTGEPIFTQMTCDVQINFEYFFLSESKVNLNGTTRMLARLSDTNGWQRNLEISPETAFHGNTATFGGNLNLCDLQKKILAFSEETLVRQQSYTLTILPIISVGGTVDSLAFEDGFTPTLIFQLDPYVVRMVETGDTRDSLIHPIKAGSLARESTIPNTILLLFYPVPVSIGRILLVCFIIACISGALLTGLPYFSKIQFDDPTIFSALYGTQIINAEIEYPGSEPVIVTVDRFRNLVKLADKNGAAILHHLDGPKHIYSIWVDNMIYQYYSFAINDTNEQDVESSGK